jgi:hypothetical protein
VQTANRMVHDDIPSAETDQSLFCKCVLVMTTGMTEF